MGDVGEGKGEAQQKENLLSCSQKKNTGFIGRDELKKRGCSGIFQIHFMEDHLFGGKKKPSVFS